VLCGLVALLATLAGRSVRAQELPGGLRLSGGVYLYHYAPVDLQSGHEKTEIYALFLNLDRTDGPWAVHVQGRWRDTKLRSFYPSNGWLQEAWVAYTVGPSDEGSGDGRPASRPVALTVTFRAGKIYQRLGRFWDGSFFGNVQYFDGLKLDPEFGAEAAARAPLGTSSGVIEAYVQGLLGDDHISGALPGRDFKTLTGARKQGLAAGVRGRIALASPGGSPLVAAVRLSGLTSRAELPDTLRGLSPAGSGSAFARVGGPHRTLDYVSFDGELDWKHLLAYGEWTRRSTGLLGPPGATIPGSRATYWLAGAHATVGPLTLRYNFSQGRYQDAGWRDTIHQPGITVRLGPGVSALLEYDDWSRRGPAGTVLMDRSLNAVLLLQF